VLDDHHPAFALRRQGPILQTGTQFYIQNSLDGSFQNAAYLFPVAAPRNYLLLKTGINDGK